MLQNRRPPPDSMKRTPALLETELSTYLAFPLLPASKTDGSQVKYTERSNANLVVEFQADC